jgi:hypothetical protein
VRLGSNQQLRELEDLGILEDTWNKLGFTCTDLAAERNVDLDLLPIMATQASKPLNTHKKCGSRPVDQ